MNKTIILNLIIMSIFLITSCYNYPINPDIVVNEYYKCLENGDFRKAYQFLSESDQNHMSFSKFEGKEDSSFKIKKEFWSLVRWKIKNVKINDDKAKVSIFFNMPNIGAILGDNIGMTLSDLDKFKNEGNAIQNIKKGILENLKKGNIDYYSLDDEIELVFEKGRWKIFFNLEVKEEIKKSIVKAIKYRNENKIDLAISEVKKVLEIDENNKIAKEYLEILRKIFREEKGVE